MFKGFCHKSKGMRDIKDVCAMLSQFPHTYTWRSTLTGKAIFKNCRVIFQQQQKKLNLVNQKLTDIKWGSGKNLRIILNIKIQNKS